MKHGRGIEQEGRRESSRERARSGAGGSQRSSWERKQKVKEGGGQRDRSEKWSGGSPPYFE